jgi:putative pyruvate formate lyase activating enzyme
MTPIDSNEKAARAAAAVGRAETLFRACTACGHRCGVDRLSGAQGFCRTTSLASREVRCASHTLHFGEEPMLVGRGGSGTVFFAHCNLRCVFCQNHQISQGGLGTDVDTDTLAGIFLELQVKDAENINLVTPTHYAYPILLALRTAYERGLALPLVYNTNGYESLDVLALLDGIVDVYLPDMKYMDAAAARKYSSAEDYPSVAQAAIKAMYRQVGPPVLSDGVAQKGLIIRHLVLPNNLAGSYDFLLWLHGEAMTDVALSLMSQYSPQHRAPEYPELASPVDRQTYRDIVQYAVDLGFEHILAQGLASADEYLPDFRKQAPFSQKL